MKNLLKSAEAKQIRLSINKNKCEIVLKKGYKYDESTGEIIGARGKFLKAKINGYIVISFIDAGKKQFLYATTFIEFILKNENEMISAEDLELAKSFVKPSSEYLVKKKALKQAKEKELSDESKDIKTTIEQGEDNQFSNSYQSNDIASNLRIRKSFNKRIQTIINRKTPVQIRSLHK